MPETHRVHEAASVAGDQPAVEVHTRHRVPAALRQGFRAIADHLAAGQQVRHQRVLLELQERLVRIEHRVFVVEPGDKTDR